MTSRDWAGHFRYLVDFRARGHALVRVFSRSHSALILYILFSQHPCEMVEVS